MASNLVNGDGDTNREYDVFLFARTSGTVTLVSHTLDSGTTAANLGSRVGQFSLSADGAFVAFLSYATNLVSATTPTAGRWTSSFSTAPRAW